ncbi:hypothetical protein AMS59_13825 [Lysinibacillus sp. FJAT-14745]|nr:hypothetical protein AMS59_13825 [Lysinibacillus sp. FJAT-14745]
MKKRPHVVLLGAGASVAAIPNGDRNKMRTSVMKGFIDKLEMREVIDNIDLTFESDNLEDIYSALTESTEFDNVRIELEERIYNYFSKFQIPDEPTVYDYLILSLTKKDLIATFNWDPLLFQAYQRCLEITDNLPELAFLHGNVSIGICNSHKVGGYIGGYCPQCDKPFERVPLLYPVKEKNYEENLFIKDQWNVVRQYLDRAYMFTIFGYSAPKTDKSAIDLLKKAWGKKEDRNLEEIEVIDIADEGTLVASWEQFIHTHHYSIHDSFFKSTIGCFPRRSCEATFDRLMNVRFLDNTKGFKVDMKFDDIELLIKTLIDEENRNGQILTHPYLFSIEK